jgi:hypothetical protein
VKQGAPLRTTTTVNRACVEAPFVMVPREQLTSDMQQDLLQRFSGVPGFEGDVVRFDAHDDLEIPEHPGGGLFACLPPEKVSTTTTPSITRLTLLVHHETALMRLHAAYPAAHVSGQVFAWTIYVSTPEFFPAGMAVGLIGSGRWGVVVQEDPRSCLVALQSGAVAEYEKRLLRRMSLDDYGMRDILIAAVLRQRAKSARMLTEAEQLLREHHADIKKIGDAMIEYADHHEWCEEYDQAVEDLNEKLSVKLRQREREYGVEVKVTYRPRVTVRATSEREARELIVTRDGEPGSALQEELSSILDGPTELDIVDVEVE